MASFFLLSLRKIIIYNYEETVIISNQLDMCAICNGTELERQPCFIDRK